MEFHITKILKEIFAVNLTLKPNKLGFKADLKILEFMFSEYNSHLLFGGNLSVYYFLGEL